MTLTTTISYNTSSGFSFSNSVLGFTNSSLRLSEQFTASSFNESFSTSTGFTFNSSFVGFSSGSATQIVQIPTTAALMFSKFSVTGSADMKWASSGVLTGTKNGTPTVTGGLLDCTGTAQKGVYWNNANIAANATQGALKVKYTPNYSGGPSTNINVLGFHASTGNLDKMLLTNSPSGNKYVDTLGKNQTFTLGSAVIPNTSTVSFDGLIFT